MKILFLTPPTPKPIRDYGAGLTSHINNRQVVNHINISMPIPAWGLYWIKENVPGVDIIDNPSWERIEAEFRKGVDILGISFYTYQYHDTMRLIAMARRYGVKEIWGGNYGIQTPGIADHFDRVFWGNAEKEIHARLYGSEPSELRHPVFLGEALLQSSLTGMVGKAVNRLGILCNDIGVLYTHTGCAYGCTFCSSPPFIKKTGQRIPMDEITRVLDAYQDYGIDSIKIMDLTFLDNKAHSEMVIREFEKRGMQWMCMTRVDKLLGRVRELEERGLYFALLGIESLNNKSLDSMRKKESREMCLEVLEEIKANNLWVNMACMIAQPEDTVQSIRKEVDFLNRYNLGVYQFNVITPYPGTAMVTV
ncbi:MAG: radical SAM protein [bacterium]